MSKLWRIPPSELYAIRDELTAYWFNRAVLHFGTAFDADMEAAADGAVDKPRDQKRIEDNVQKALARTRDRWLKDEGDTPAQKPQFRDPAAFFGTPQKVD